MRKPLSKPLRIAAGIACALIAPSAGMTQANVWTPPEGCAVFLTVQSKACRVSNYYRCESDQKGDQWRADFDQEGLFFRSRINAEAEWVESIEGNGFGPEVHQYLDPDPADRASFTELLETGIDTFDFTLARSDGGHSRVTGYDRLTGQMMTIDGVQLEQTEFEFTEIDDYGNTLRRANGNEYISRDMRTFFSGAEQVDLGNGEWLPLDGTPLRFFFPGQKGFAAKQPLFDCDALTADVTENPLLWRVSSDKQR